MKYSIIKTVLVFLFSLNTGWADIIITEIADPNDNTNSFKPRYIEIHNSGGSSVTLTDYYIIRWTNANASPTTNINLSSYTLAAGGFLIFIQNSTDWESVFSAGSATVVDVVSGNAADSNGDDNMAIVTEASGQTFNHTDANTFDIVDIFGVSGEDGTGTWHEFEDGRAERVSTSTSASGATASSSDWNTYSDSETWLAGVDQNAGNSLISTTTAFTDNGFDPGAWDGYRSVSISGSSDHFRMMSSPVAGQIYSDLLSELWTQGMAGADVTTSSANVWTYDAASTPVWTALSNLNTASLTAGQGFLIYVYTNTDNSGATNDLPVTLSVSGTENSGNVTVPSSGSIDNDAWALAGNPYASTIDWGLVTQTAVTTSAYVWDSQASTPAYISWNGTDGSLTGGLIAPYQGFWIKGSGGSGSITIAEADKSSTAGTFYKTMNDSTGSMSFAISSGDYSDITFVSFMNNGEEGIDNSDAYKLLPMSPSERVVGISYAEGNGLDINNLPYIHDGSISIPLDIMYLTLDADYNFVTNENEVTMNWDLSSLPETIIGLT